TPASAADHGEREERRGGGSRNRIGEDVVDEYRVREVFAATGDDHRPDRAGESHRIRDELGRRVALQEAGVGIDEIGAGEVGVRERLDIVLIAAEVAEVEGEDVDRHGELEDEPDAVDPLAIPEGIE